MYYSCQPSSTTSAQLEWRSGNVNVVPASYKAGLWFLLLLSEAAQIFLSGTFFSSIFGFTGLENQGLGE